MLINLAIACVPAALMGFLIYDWLKETFFNPVTVAWALLIALGVFLLVYWDVRVPSIFGFGWFPTMPYN